MVPANPYLKPGMAGSGRQTYDSYEIVNQKAGRKAGKGSPRPQASVRTPGSTAGLDRRLSPPGAAAKPKSPKSPPRRDGAGSAVPPPVQYTEAPYVPPPPPPPPPAAEPPAPPPPPPRAPPRPAIEAIAAEVHELKELFAAPARPPAPPPDELLLPIHPGYSAAFQEHRASSPRPWKPVSAPKDAAPRARAAPIQHVRQVVSKYGGMIETGSTLVVPPQPWERNSPRLSAESLSTLQGRPNQGAAGATQGHHARKDGFAGRAGMTNQTLCEAEPSFRARSPPVATVVQPGGTRNA